MNRFTAAARGPVTATCSGMRSATAALPRAATTLLGPLDIDAFNAAIGY